ncbi:MAG: bifunctional riboflavin kinase/FAD synthetase [Oscillospiraceae bacterium]|nr:bifunctional riboflavin kinase/FAD synthetase [Oscillospiraceae bacterium]
MENNNQMSCVALGLFDGVHLGHKAVIENAVRLSKAMGLVPTAFTFVNGADSVKGVKPIITDEEKCQRLSCAGIENVYTAEFDSVKELTPQEFFERILIEKLHCKGIVCGYDFRFGKNATGDVTLLKELCKKNGICLTVVDKVTANGRAVSSTAIRELISQGEISKANELLGYRLCYSSAIVHGRQLGRQMDFPTVNQSIAENIVLPRFGVYKSEIELCGKVYKGVTNVGTKPTVNDSGMPCLETHILDFEGDVYGEVAKLYLCEFLREETKFSSVSELRAQIKKDILRVRE